MSEKVYCKDCKYLLEGRLAYLCTRNGVKKYTENYYERSEYYDLCYDLNKNNRCIYFLRNFKN